MKVKGKMTNATYRVLKINRHGAKLKRQDGIKFFVPLISYLRYFEVAK